MRAPVGGLAADFGKAAQLTPRGVQHAAMALSHWTSRSCWITSPTELMGVAKIYFLVFGVLTIAGGIMGYVKAGSTASIIAGSITGILLIVAGLVLPEHRALGVGLGLVVSLLLAGQFIPKFIRTGRMMPAGMMTVLSAIGIVMAVAAWLRK
jgi:uncharacterized membrane protein (UPF0136 family)